jgi:hypothetical protein
MYTYPVIDKDNDWECLWIIKTELQLNRLNEMFEKYKERTDPRTLEWFIDSWNLFYDIEFIEEKSFII